MELKFNKDGLIPVIAQDYNTGRVLMQAYMNQEAYDKTIETGKVHYYSRSRKSLWLKGETSGQYQIIKRIRVDCDQDCLLVQVLQEGGGACHTGAESCFFTTIVDQTGEPSAQTCVEPLSPNQTTSDLANAEQDSLDKGSKPETVLQKLYETVIDRQRNPKEGSYTNYLFDKGLDKILKKVGEETAEVLIASKNQSKSEITYETADLLYHLTVLLVDRGLTWKDITDELLKRTK